MGKQPGKVAHGGADGIKQGGEREGGLGEDDAFGQKRAACDARTELQK